MGAAPPADETLLGDLLRRDRAERAGPRRRGTYRVQAQELQRVAAALILQDIRVPVQLLDLSARGAGVRTDANGARALEQAAEAGATTRLVLELALPGAEHPVQNTARAVQAIADAEGMRLGLRLAPAEREDLEAQLLPLFNQRRSLRVSTGRRGSFPVRVLGPDGAQAAEAQMMDLSVEGMGIRLESSVDLAVGTRVTLRFQVGSSDEPVEMNAVVRHIRPAGNAHGIVGCAFDPDHPDTARARTRVGAFIVRRQLEMRRRR